jgi:hypothetical protein
MSFEANLDGKTIARAYVEEDTYKARLVSIGDPFLSTGYDNKEKEKFVIKFQLTEDMDKFIPMYLTTKISKGDGEYSNSKLYDLLDSAKLIDKFKILLEALEEDKDKDIAIMHFLRKHLTLKEVKILTKTANKNDKEKRYSVVEKVVKFE